MFSAATALGSFDHILQVPNAIYIVDGKGAYTRKAMTLVVASSDDTNLTEFLKGRAQLRFMPVWRKPDLMAARELLYSSVTKERAEELYAKWGGVPRNVLERANHEDWQSMLETAFNRSPPLQLILRNLGELDQPNIFSHTLLHYDVQPGYIDTRIVSASQYVADRVVSGAFQEAQQEIRNFLVAQQHNTQAGGMHSQVWESFAHNLLQQQSSYQLRRLSGNAATPSAATIWPEAEYGTFAESERALQNADQMLPCARVKNNPAFDAVDAS